MVESSRLKGRMWAVNIFGLEYRWRGKYKVLLFCQNPSNGLLSEVVTKGIAPIARPKRIYDSKTRRIIKTLESMSFELPESENF